MGLVITGGVGFIGSSLPFTEKDFLEEKKQSNR